MLHYIQILNPKQQQTELSRIRINYFSLMLTLTIKTVLSSENLLLLAALTAGYSCHLRGSSFSPLKNAFSHDSISAELGKTKYPSENNSNTLTSFKLKV